MTTVKLVPGNLGWVPYEKKSCLVMLLEVNDMYITVLHGDQKIRMTTRPVFKTKKDCDVFSGYRAKRIEMMVKRAQEYRLIMGMK